MAPNTQDLPPLSIGQRPLAEAEFAQRLEAALRASLTYLIDRPLETEEFEITRPTSDGFGPATVTGPDYRRAIWREANALTQQTGSTGLWDYLWDHGAFRKQMSRDDGQPVPRHHGLTPRSESG